MTEQKYASVRGSTTFIEQTDTNQVNAHTPPDNRQPGIWNPVTSTGKDFSDFRFYALSLDLETRAERSDRPLPLMLSGMEHVQDALQAYKNTKIEGLEMLIAAYAKDENTTFEEFKDTLVNGDFARELNAIKTIDSYLDLISTQIAADLREIGNSFLQKEVSRG